MTSKEALEKLYDGYQNGIAGRSFFDIIKQDLDRLEKIEKWVNDKLDYLNNGVFLVPGDYLKGAIKILLELKEVLTNDK